MASTKTLRPAVALPDLDKIPPYASICACALTWAVVFLPFWPVVLGDISVHVQPWLDYIRSNGGFAALENGFSEYAPPYLYLLTAATYLDLPVGDLTLVKLINVPFVLLISLVVFRFCRHFGQSLNFSVAAASGVVLLPTVSVNAFVWGQADTIYTPFLLLATLLTLTNKPYWAVAAFAAAVSIKLQAIFLAPFMLLAIFAGRIPWRAVVVAPVVYLFSILPAALYGRPIFELVTIYVHQGRFYAQLSMNAPNFYLFLDFFLGASRSSLVYKIGTVAGLLVASITGALISLIGFGRRNLSDRALLLAATLSMTVMPYVLPKMHDRFFFGADLFTFALACVDRRFIWAAVAMQVSSGLSYVPQFALILDPDSYGYSGWAVVLGAVINSVVVARLAIELKRELGVLWNVPALRRQLQELASGGFWSALYVKGTAR